MAAEIVSPYIKVEAAVAGGQPHIAGRRITVRDVALRRLCGVDGERTPAVRRPAALAVKEESDV